MILHLSEFWWGSVFISLAKAENTPTLINYIFWKMFVKIGIFLAYTDNNDNTNEDEDDD